MIMRKYLVAVIVLPLVLATALLGQKAPPVYTTKGDLALSGYDAVSYFKDGKPAKGKAEFSYQWMDATWRFSSAENLDAFKTQTGEVCAAIWRLLRLWDVSGTSGIGRPSSLEACG